GPRRRQQQQLTESELSITIQGNQGKAEYQRALQQAAQIRALAEADAEKAARIGIATAIAIEEQVRAYGGPPVQLTQQGLSRFAEAIQTSRVDVVPKVVIGGQNGNSTGNVMEALLTLLMSEKLGQTFALPRNGNSANPEAERIRTEIRDSLAAGKAVT